MVVGAAPENGVPGSRHTGGVTELEPDDLRWAEEFGARWGATFSRPSAAQREISRDFTEACNPPLNARTVAHLKGLLGVTDDDELTDEQLASGRPYLMAMAEIALREVQWALWWRRDLMSRGSNDPGLKYLERRSNPKFRTFLEGFGPLGGSIAGPSDETIKTDDDASTSGREHRRPAAGLSTKQSDIMSRREERFEQERLEQNGRRPVTRRQGRAAERERWRAERETVERERRTEEAQRTAHEAAERNRIRREQEEIRRRRPLAPAPQPYGVNHQGAERFAADWMRHLGVRDAQVTQYSGDGGIDVSSRHLVAQVKNLSPSASVPIAQIRDLFGTATHQKKSAVLFTSGLVSQTGLTFADETGMALIRYNAERGELTGFNLLGRQAIAIGFPEAFGFDEF